MDEKQIAAFEEKYGKRPSNDAQRADAWDDRLRVWLACYQHLAPMVEDAERYRWLRADDNDEDMLQFSEHARDGKDDVWLFRGEKLDSAIDAAREQEKKTC